jgi:hypothetical protein
MAINNLKQELIEKSTAFKMFGKRYVDFNKDEMREYNRIVQQRRRSKLNGFNKDGKE